MQAENVRSDGLVDSLLPDISYDEDVVEPGEDGGLEIDLFGSVLEVVVSAEERIGSCEDRSSRVEDRGDTCLGDGDRLLLHCFVDSYSVLGSHFVELVNTYDTSISQDHCSSFQLESAIWILKHRGRKTCRRRALTTSVYRYRCYSINKFQELGLGNGGIAKQKNVDVSTKLHAIWKFFWASTEEQARNSFFDVLVAKNGRSNTFAELFVDIGIPSHLLKFFLILLSNIWLGEPSEASRSVINQGIDAQNSDVRLLNCALESFI